VIANGFIEAYKTLYDTQRSTLEDLSIDLMFLEVDESIDFSKLNNLKTLKIRIFNTESLVLKFIDQIYSMPQQILQTIDIVFPWVYH
jgi:hypothetical protein